jgi:phosphatidylglycerophosphatase A
MSEPDLPAPSNPPKAGARGFAYWFAIAGGLGKLPKAPGAWGSLAGVALAWLFGKLEFGFLASGSYTFGPFNPLFWWLALSAAGVWAAGRVERAAGKKDPQEVVVDEVSGQWLALLASPAMLSGSAGWKSFLAGFILFRVFDMTKPFPAGRAESLPGGWGIMADDWVAGGYAAVALWVAHWIGF